MDSSDEFTLTEILIRAAEGRPNAEIVEFIGQPPVTNWELRDRSARAAAVLQQSGVGPGDRVAIMLNNREEFLWAYFGAAFAGAVAVPINTSLKGPILEYMLADSEPRLLIAEPELLETCREAISNSTGATKLVAVEPTGDGAGTDFRSAVEQAPEGRYEPTKPWTLTTILYTAGTTGPSKGIMVCNRMALAFPRAVIEAMEYREADVLYNALPLFHGNAINISLLPALLVGGKAVFSDRFSASRWWDEVRACGATAISLLGSMVPILWNRPESDDDAKNGVRVALAVPAPVAEYEAFEKRFGLRLASLYGMTDCGLPILTPPEGGRPGYAGIPHRDWECKVVNDEDEEVPDGEVGELVLRPKRPYITQLGYWRNAEATVEAWRNLWFHTGDRLIRDPDGWFRFVDRKKDAIRRFGENISSFEVESVLLRHPSVAEVAVYPVPAELEEDEVMAAVVLEPDTTTTPEELYKHARKLLPYFAVPRFIDIRLTLPMTPTEKVIKQDLRREGVTATTWDGGPVGKRYRAEQQRPA